MTLIRTTRRTVTIDGIPIRFEGSVAIPPEMIDYGATLLDDVILQNGAPVGHFDWTSAYVPKPPYNARNRRRWSDQLIPEGRNR